MDFLLEPVPHEEAAPRRAEMLLRLHGAMAYSADSWRVMDAQRDVFPWWQYRGIGDARMRSSHAALDGKVFPANSPFWQRHFPPWEWGCRCQVIPLMDEDVEELRAAEAGKPLEERTVIEGPALQAVEERNTLIEGPNKIHDLRTPSERGQRGGFEWSPGDMRVPLETLRERYEPEVFRRFEEFARRTVVPDTQISVWQWLAGEKFGLSAPRPIQDVEARIVHDKARETAVAVASDGRVLLEKTGEVDRVEFSAAEMQRIAGSTVTHNHPSGEGFSKSDIQTAMLANLAELRVVGANSSGVRHLYSLRPATGAWRAAAWPEISAVYETLSAEVESALRAEIADGTITTRQAGDEHSHRVLTRLAARFPKIFRYERTTI